MLSARKLQAGAPNQGHRLLLSYLGTPFAGWQRQPGKTTVQETLEDALARIWKRPVAAAASGRTDTGVHALGQVVSFLAPRLHEAGTLRRAINANLPPSIRVVKASLVDAAFHARFDSTGKTYRYFIRNHPLEDPFALDRCWHVPRPLDFEKMTAAARFLVGSHDFASFTSNPGYERETTVRSMREVALRKRGAIIVVTVTADGFLYRMVRNIVGGLVKVGLGKLTVAEFGAVLAARRRSAAPATAPAHGLFLWKVYYDGK